MSDHSGRRWLIPGCLILVAIALLLVLTLGGRVWWSIRSADPQTSSFVRQAPEGSPVNSEDALPRRARLSVLFELDSCEAYLEPAAPGEPLSVEAYYDANDYRLEEIVDEANPNAYRLRFLVASSRLITGIKQGLRGGQPQLRIRLPVDTPLELKLVQRNGGAIVDLSGLWLDAADFDVRAALLKVDADEPLAGELERFNVEASQGALVLESLNLMRPREIAIDFRMGEAQLDFRGSWQADARIDLDLSVADTIVRLPRDVRIEGLGDVRLRTSPEELRPTTLNFSVESGTRSNLRVFD